MYTVDVADVDSVFRELLRRAESELDLKLRFRVSQVGGLSVVARCNTSRHCCCYLVFSSIAYLTQQPHLQHWYAVQALL